MNRFLVITLVAACALIATTSRIASVSAQCEGIYAPSGVPFVWTLNETTLLSESWRVPSTLFPGQIADNLTVSFGDLAIKSYDQVASEVTYPEEYAEFDDQQNTRILFLPMTFQNHGDKTVGIEFFEFEIYRDSIPQRFASYLTPLYNEHGEEDYYIEPGETKTISVAFRALRSGYPKSSDWDAFSQGRFSLVVVDFPNLYTKPLNLIEGY